MQPLHVVISSDRLGEGERELGELLMGNYLKNLSLSNDLPSVIFLINRGVFLATKDSLCSEFLGVLQEEGVTIQLCQTCIEYYNVGKEVAVGEISGMNRLVEIIASGRVVFI